MMPCKKNPALNLAILGLIWFTVCFFWGYALPADAQEFHSSFMSISVLGWSGMTLSSFVLGLAQWFIWGWLIGWSFSLVCSRSKDCCSKKK